MMTMMMMMTMMILGDLVTCQERRFQQIKAKLLSQLM